jgi:rhodanese-related sulfurtransferase
MMIDTPAFIYYFFTMKYIQAPIRTTPSLYIVFAAFILLMLLLHPLEASGTDEAESTGIDYRNADTLKALIAGQDSPYLLVDVRTPAEYESGFIPTAVNIPVSDLPGAMPDAGKDDLIILYCRSGNRSGQAASILRKEGFTNISDFGGISRWKGALDRP